ncbi:LysE family translocator [Sediminivirga luteola]|uniref:Threonine/homoserine/homoserine lactone efflux protein n=1 Tax=Sediminivirga luteola TaxID=1774748 RepID=A0A8J2TVB8_9MICO|nr:LysE family translocator [Sediminivirga luteola]GGA03162.1 hypothetical protein GCM10011333_02280 [Sediminivirga luteola]
MTPHGWLLLALTWAVAIATPGPDIFLLLRLGARERRAAVLAALGIMSGNALWIAASVLGLTALLLTLPWALPVLQALGSCVLLWLGVQSIRAGVTGLRTGTRDSTPAPATRRPWALGLMTNLSNPKAIIFFTALITQFLPAEASGWDKAGIAALMIVTGLLWFTGVALAASAQAFRRRFRQAAPWLDLIAGVVFIGVAAVILAELAVAALP